jgi:hypothetical protein
VIDLGARITNLRATEAALQKIMEQATKIPDVLDVQSKLTEVRGEIERLVAQKLHLEDQAAYGTLVVTFVLPVQPVVEEVKAGWDPAAGRGRRRWHADQAGPARRVVRDLGRDRRRADRDRAGPDPRVRVPRLAAGAPAGTQPDGAVGDAVRRRVVAIWRSR